MLGQRARPVRRAGTGKPTTERLHGVSSPTQHRRLDADGNAALFQVISQRYLKASVIITSHAGIATWADRFADPMMAAAVLDRLLHRGVVIAIDGPSYRMRAHQARAEQLRRAVRP